MRATICFISSCASAAVRCGGVLCCAGDACGRISSLWMAETLNVSWGKVEVRENFARCRGERSQSALRQTTGKRGQSGISHGVDANIRLHRIAEPPFTDPKLESALGP